ncbi:2,3-diaminopropionate biosynthesis protein SbnB [Dactylosporangium sp. NPDC050588]|uniref:2,3-diaminopropionate biosynthesis protein SbnB n=1 Tax=Dactylosporangium sp. NPDC050588 TaxID=3157211 RepID=UPI0034115BA1
MSTFHVVGVQAVRTILDSGRPLIRDIVRAAYLQHYTGHTVNPDSYFLRFPDRPADRIIALPARLSDDAGDDAGLKWIGSFPGNLGRGLPRASAVVILNDMSTGFPYACIEGSLISAARTAASAAIAARHLHPSTQRQRLGVVGCGVIARALLDFLAADGWHFDSVAAYDVDPVRAAAFTDHVGPAAVSGRCASVAEVVRRSELVVFTTTAVEPHVFAEDLFTARHTVLHLSLRDLAVGVVLRAQNIVDDIDHALKANTSLHRAEQAVGHRAFVSGVLAQVIAGALEPDPARPRVFSPFGLGVLDLAVARHVYRQAIKNGLAQEIPGFFAPFSNEHGA